MKPPVHVSDEGELLHDHPPGKIIMMFSFLFHAIAWLRCLLPQSSFFTYAE
jgi:hypothetical protein